VLSADLDLCARCGNQFSWPQVCGNCRPSWDEYFLSIARVVASRSDCVRRQAGAVVVRDRRIVATGYNGAPAGKPGCRELPCPRSLSDVAPGSSYDTGPGSCIAIHAEANALVYADYDKCAGATMYVTCEPCDGCLRLIDAAGIALTTWRGKDA
jgi:dCMP deaminase